MWKQDINSLSNKSSITTIFYEVYAVQKFLEIFNNPVVNQSKMLS